MIRLVQMQKENNTILLVLEIILKDGSVVMKGLQMPATIFSMRAGEYGLDPVADEDAIWDIVLHEHHLDIQETLPLLVTADTLEEARDQHLERVRYEKDKLNERKRPDAWTDDEKKTHAEIKAALKQHMIVDSELIDLVRQHTKKHMLGHKALVSKPVDHLEHLKQSLRSRGIEIPVVHPEHMTLPGGENESRPEQTDSATSPKAS